MNKKTIKDVSDWKGKRVLVRCDFNVPMKDGRITDENRITGALPTIEYLTEHGAKVILCSHMGKPHSILSEEVKLSKRTRRRSKPFQKASARPPARRSLQRLNGRSPKSSP